MPSINHVLVMGHLGADPEIRSLNDGRAVASARVATSYKPRDGEESTEWHNVVAFGAMADQLAECRKGDLVTVQGRLQTRKWTGQDGNDRYTTEIVASVAVRSRWHKADNGDGRGHTSTRASADSSANRASQRMQAPASAPFDDGIPFDRLRYEHAW